MKALIALFLIALSINITASRGEEAINDCKFEPNEAVCVGKVLNRKMNRMMRMMNNSSMQEPTAEKCKCTKKVHSSSDTDYLLQLEHNGTWSTIDSFTTSDSGPRDLRNCLNKKNVEPLCK